MKKLSIFELKCIAAFCMVLDHAGEYLGLPIVCRYLGRLAIPIFIFCCVQGCLHTTNKKRYLLRLYIAGICMSFFDAWAQISVNFFRTLFSIALLIFLYEWYRETKAKKIWIYYILWQILTTFLCYLTAIIPWIDLENIGMYVLPAVFGNLFFLEGGVFYVFVGLWFYYARDNLKKLSIGYVILVLGFVFGLQSNPYLVYGLLPKVKMLGMIGEAAYDFFEEILGNWFLCVGVLYYESIADNYQWMMIGALPVIWMYNGTKGRSGKWFFYLFYPVHYILFYWIGLTGR